MEKEQPQIINFVSQEEWDLTPKRVKNLVLLQKQRIEELEKQLAQLKAKQEELAEKVNTNWPNSSVPPSSEMVKPEKKKSQKRKKRRRGGQKGHPGDSRQLYPPVECTKIEEHKPETCKCCGEKLGGSESNPHRHQVREIAEIKLNIEEHR